MKRRTQRWDMLPRCAQCETYRDVSTLDPVARARMLAELPVPSAALQRGLIVAADFAPR
jgi:hypothetical protein